MSKYNLTDLIPENVIKESMSRGGTVNDSFYNIANLADDIDGKNVGVDTYPIQVKRLGPTSDGKTNEEIVVRYGEGHKEYFSIYDYKFGEDPTDEDNYQTDYPFSLGIPTGNKSGKEWAAKLGFAVGDMNESTEENMNEENNIKEEDGFTEVSTKEIRFHLDAYRAGNIEGDDLAQAIEEIVFGETRAPGTMEEEEKPDGMDIYFGADAKEKIKQRREKAVDFLKKHKEKYGLKEDDTLNEDCCAKAEAALKGEDSSQVATYLKSLKNDVRLNGEDSYKDFSSEDFVEDFKEYVGNKSLEEHFKRFM